MSLLFEHLALAVAAAFTGAAIIINVSEQPARLSLADQPLLAEWKRGYPAALKMQASLAAIGGLLGFASWWATGDWRWTIGGLLMIANGPYTFAAIMPVNKVLEATPETQADARTRALIVQWGRLHAVRSALGLAATLACCWAAG